MRPPAKPLQFPGVLITWNEQEPLWISHLPGAVPVLLKDSPIVRLSPLSNRCAKCVVCSLILRIAVYRAFIGPYAPFPGTNLALVFCYRSRLNGMFSSRCDLFRPLYLYVAIFFYHWLSIKHTLTLPSENFSYFLGIQLNTCRLKMTD